MKKQLYKFLSALFVVAILTISASATASPSTCSPVTAASLKSFDCTALLNQIFSIQPGSHCGFKLSWNPHKDLKAVTAPNVGKNCSKVPSSVKDCTKAPSNGKDCVKTPCTGSDCAKTAVVTPPKAETPVVTPPKAENPVVTLPKAETPVVTPPKAENPVVTPPNAETPVVTPPKAETPVVTPPAAENPNGISAYEMEVINLVNEIRTSNGLNALKPNAKLSEIARTKSQDMRTNGYFAHQSPTYGSPFDMLRQFGVTYRTAGENIAYGYPTPAAVVDGWMNSQGHRENILKSTYTEIGVGYVESGHYWTQLFTG